MTPSFELTEERRQALAEELSLPPDVSDKDAVIEHFMVRAAEASEDYWGAYLLLGRHFLLEDCEQAKTYLARYLERSEDSDGRELLIMASNQGCEAAAEFARVQWSSEE